MTTTLKSSLLARHVAGAALLVTLLGAAGASAQTTPGATTPVGVDPSASGIDLAEAPEVATMIQDEATHRDRLARIRRLRELASQGNQRDRLAQLDDLERRERQRHEARVVRDRSLLSDRSARGVDDIVRRGGSFRAPGRDVSIARQRKFGTSDPAVTRRGNVGSERGPTRATRSSSSSRTPARAPSRGNGTTSRRSTSGSSSGGRGPR
jgi:hypothetical protein